MKITVQKFVESDIPIRVEWINNPLINNQMFFDIPASFHNTLSWFNGLSQNKTRIDFSFYDENHLCVGMAGITDIDLKNENAEFYVMVNPDCQGKGYGYTITLWVINYAFLNYNLNKIYLYTNTSNSKAVSLYEKIGFVKEGILRNHKYKNGAFQDRAFYGLLREEWLEKEWKVDLINLEFDANRPYSV